MFRTVSLVFVGLFLSQVSWAEQVPARWERVTEKFNFFSNKSFYTCDYVEARAEDILERLGARNIEVDCRGGLPHWDNNWVTASFDVIKESTADKATTQAQAAGVSLSFFESCDLHERMMKQLSRKFEVIQKTVRGSCWDSRGQLDYNITLLSEI
jgi:hypothetical protein